MCNAIYYNALLSTVSGNSDTALGKVLASDIMRQTVETVERRNRQKKMLFNFELVYREKKKKKLLTTWFHLGDKKQNISYNCQIKMSCLNKLDSMAWEQCHSIATTDFCDVGTHGLVWLEKMSVQLMKQNEDILHGQEACLAVSPRNLTALFFQY